MAKDARGRELPKGIRQRDNGTFEGRVAVDGKRVSVYGNTVTEDMLQIIENQKKFWGISKIINKNEYVFHPVSYTHLVSKTADCPV